MSVINLNNTDAIYFGSRKVDRIYAGAQRVWPGWTPADLFANFEQGAWYDPSDTSTLFQDSAGMTPVTEVWQHVGLMLDKSGNEFHISQPSTSSRPQLREDSEGRRYLYFDGVDDFMMTGAYPEVRRADIFFALNAYGPESLALYVVDWRRGDPPSGNTYMWRVFNEGGTGSSGGVDKLTSNPLNLPDGTPGVAVWRNTANGRINTITFAHDSAQRAQVSLYEYFDVARLTTEQERQAAIAYMAQKSGAAT